MNSCKHCGIPTKNPSFCSTKCSAIVNNTISKRKRKTFYCRCCGDIVGQRRTLCDICIKPKDMPLSEACYYGYGRASTYCLVRSRAKYILKEREYACSKCGYSKHVEVCHIKPISEFSQDTMVSEINSPDNLILLCPNCHWEFDHP